MTVHLVGVGPGDAELMTMKAARLLAEADAVVFDRLIGDEILDHVGPSAERYPVGKTPGKPGPDQDEINDLLIALGRRLTTVVRVKGGDPFVFGRGIEEAEALAAADVAVEVVPGISSSLAGPLSAGVSVTHRGVSSGVCILTAHQDPESEPIDWSAVARSGLTVVVLMGARRAATIRQLLTDGGMDRATPTAVITNATRPNQAVSYGQLADLGTQPVPSPSVLVIGQVAAKPTSRDDAGDVQSADVELRELLRLAM